MCGGVSHLHNMDRYTVSGSGADCKSVILDSGGSTPSLSTRRVQLIIDVGVEANNDSKIYLPTHVTMNHSLLDV